MKSLNPSLLLPLTAWLVMGAAPAQAQTTPEVLHYKFSGTGTSVPNLASAPPAGTATATIMGGLTQTGADLNFEGGGFSLMGSGVTSTTDYLNTGWAPNLGTGSWTIAFISSNITPSATLFYIFGDLNTASFRCFTNGVAGANNWILRGAGLTDIYVNGGATVAPHRIAFVYDSTLNNVKGYLDGVLVSTVAQTAPNVTGTGPFKVMGYSGNVGAPAGGLLDDFRVYNRALSAAEVAGINVPVKQDFHTLEPCRVVDTRNAAGPLGGPALDALADRTFVLAGACGIPADAKSVSLNLAVTGSTNPGNLRLHAGGTSVPLVSSINFTAGQTRSNNAVVPLSALGELAAYLDQLSGTAHLILDVNGYFK